jgi:hypothetical protein
MLIITGSWTGCAGLRRGRVYSIYVCKSLARRPTQVEVAAAGRDQSGRRSLYRKTKLSPRKRLNRNLSLVKTRVTVWKRR